MNQKPQYDIGELINSWLLWKTETTGEEYTQKQLSGNSGLDESYISQLKRCGKNGNKKPKNFTLYKIANALGLTVSEFLAGPSSLDSRKKSHNEYKYLQEILINRVEEIQNRKTLKRIIDIIEDLSTLASSAE